MTRRRSSAPGARSPRRLLLVLPIAALLAAACGSSGLTISPTVPAETLAPATQEPATPEPQTPEPVTPGPEPSAEPLPTAEPEPTDEPVPTEQPVSGDVGHCTGTDENRDFYASVAAAVSWPVYCPSLPRGWNVEAGQYRLANSGRMEISYRGPSGAGLRLQEGAFCSGDACAPSGEELGAASFGDRDGTFYRVDGGWAVSVDPGERISWLLVVTGVDETRARAFARGLVRLDG